MSIGPTGTLIALATADGIILYRCNWSAPAQSGSACEAAPLGHVQGGAVAISPDEKRIAVGDQAGAVTLYDLAGNAIGDPKSFDGPINALGWASQRDWLAVGTTKGEIAVLDFGAEHMPVVTQQKFGADSITALAGVSSGTRSCLRMQRQGRVPLASQSRRRSGPAVQTGRTLRRP